MGALVALLRHHGGSPLECFLKLFSLLLIGVEELVSVLLLLRRILADEDGLQAELVESLQPETAATFLLAKGSLTSSLLKGTSAGVGVLGPLEAVICNTFRVVRGLSVQVVWVVDSTSVA